MQNLGDKNNYLSMSFLFKEKLSNDIIIKILTDVFLLDEKDCDNIVKIDSKYSNDLYKNLGDNLKFIFERRIYDRHINYKHELKIKIYNYPNINIFKDKEKDICIKISKICGCSLISDLPEDIFSSALWLYVENIDNNLFHNPYVIDFEEYEDEQGNTIACEFLIKNKKPLL